MGKIVAGAAAQTLTPTTLEVSVLNAALLEIVKADSHSSLAARVQ